MRFLSNTLWIIGEKLGVSLLGFLVMIVVARGLGPADFGTYSYVFAMAAVFSIVGHMGLDGILVRELKARPDDAPATLGSVFGLRFAGYLAGAAALLAYGLLAPGHTAAERWLFALAAMMVLLSTAKHVLGPWFHSRVESRYAAISEGAAALATGLGKIGLVAGGAGVVAIGAAQAMTVVVATLLLLVFFLKRGGPRPGRWSLSRGRMRELLSEGWLIFLGMIFAVIYLKIDQAMLRWLTGPESVGVYAVAARFSEVAYFIPIALTTTVFPRLVELKAKDEMLFAARLQDLFYLLSMMAFAVMVMLVLLAPWLISVAFGTDYAEAAPILMVHMLAMPFVFMRFAFSRWILIERFAVFSAVSQGTGAVLNVLMNLWLIPLYGGLGAALATLISYMGACYLALLFSSRTRVIFQMMSRALFMPWRGGPIAWRLLGARMGRTA